MTTIQKCNPKSLVQRRYAHQLVQDRGRGYSSRLLDSAELVQLYPHKMAPMSPMACWQQGIHNKAPPRLGGKNYPD
uniref:Uncharacterized protein n=1 Tax=Arundo donax TaxID=35708 RepID=A0A0A9DWY4_ARUDO